MTRIFLLFVAAGLVGCVDEVTADEGERGVGAQTAVAEFDPARKVIPFPNNLLLDPATGKLALPAQCGETATSTALRTQVLNALDGFGTSKTIIQATLTQPVEPSSLAQRIVLIRLATGGVPADGSEGPVPVTVTPGKSVRFSVDCASSSLVDNVTIVPDTPLRGSSTYAVALFRGITSVTGAEVLPSPTWALVRQSTAPVEIVGSGTSTVVTKNLTPFDPHDPSGLASIVGLSQLWRVHAPVLAALDAAPGAPRREDILLAWSFNTQTIGAPFDAAVEGSPASQLTSETAPDALVIEQSIPAAGVAAFYTSQFGAGTCGALGCQAIGSLHFGTYLSPSFQSGEDCDAATPVPPGPWSDPVRPAKVCDQPVPYVAVVPALPPGPSGYRTVIFAHGLTRSKGDLLVLAGRLASQGIASIAIDAVAHGARAIRVSSDAQLGCAAAGVGNACTTNIDATCATQCYAPIFSSNFAATRDNLRQTVLDTLKLQRILQSCQTEGACADFWVNAEQVGYLGQSLGALIGGVTVPVSPALDVGVLNVGGGDWASVFSYTSSVGIRCPLLDALIDAGLLTGEKWSLGANANALCLDPTSAWRGDPAYQNVVQIARWVLDPVDPVNYAAGLRSNEARNVLIQEVLADAVIPNEATDHYGGLLGPMRTAAAVASSPAPEATEVASMPGNAWILYSPVQGDAATLFPGNTYAHGSLLPAPTADPATLLGTIQMQTDAMTFLVAHFR